MTVQTDLLPPARLVEESAADLQQLGCEERPVLQNDLTDVPPGKPYRVAAADQTPGTLHLCTPMVASTLQVRAGQVAGTWDWVTCAAVGRIPVIGSKVEIPCYVYETAASAAEWLTGEDQAHVTDAVAAGSKKVLEKSLEWTLLGLATVAAWIGSWLLDLALTFLGFALTAGNFITHPMVLAGWPFIQGIANLGFLLALIFIAFAPTLQLDVGGGIRRLLPRLLIAALLINFSLVIAGFVIEVANVLMAILVRTLTTGSLDELAGQLKHSSHLLHVIIENNNLGLSVYNTTASAVVNAILIWALALGFSYLAVGLVIRYIMLILLLIVSPIAYLSFAIPNAEKIGMQWWQQFFKYVFYGPIALFFLVIAISLENVIADVGGTTMSSGTAIDDIVKVVLMTAIVIAAAIAAKQMGGTFAVATINAAQGGAKRVGKRTLKAGRGTMKAGGKAAWWGTKKAADQADLGRRTKNAADRLAQRTGVNQLSPYYWDERKKQREKRAKREAGRSHGAQQAKEEYASPARRASLQREAQWAQEVQRAPADPTHAALAPERLRNLTVQKEVNAAQLHSLASGVAAGTTSDEQLEIIVNSPQLISNMDVDTPQIIMNELRGQLAAAANAEQRNEARRMIDNFNRSIREAERRAREDEK